MVTSIKSDPAEIAKAVKVLFPEGSVVELRCPGRKTTGGYFDDHQALVKAASGITAGNVYVVMNEINPALLARRANRIDYADKTTSDSPDDITRRRWLLIDLDVQGPSGISRTNEEHEDAILKAREIGKAMVALGWPKPVLADSGNGGHLLFRIDLPNDADCTKLVQRVLGQFGVQFDDDDRCSPCVRVDQTVYNASRITKCYGTVARKGDPTEARPHRASKLIFVPDSVEVVTREQLEEFAGPEPPAPERKAYQQSGQSEFDLRAFIGEYLQVRSEGPYTNLNGAIYRWKLETCALCGESDKSAVVLEFNDGRIGYRCQHNRCLDKGWPAIREHFQPGYRDRRAKRPTVEEAREIASRQSRKTPAEVIRFQPFPTSALPKPVRGFVTAAAKAIGCDTSYVALPAITACGSVIGNSRRLRIKAGWTEPAILWTVIVGESGAGKTPPIKQALKPLRERQGAAIKRFTEAMAQYEIDLAHWDKENTAWKRKGDDAGEPPEKPIPPMLERCIVSDCTVESLAPILLANPRGLLLARDELAGWIGSFDRYAAKGGADAAHWLSMNSGENIIVDRKTGVPRTIFVPKASVSVTGGIQPRILERALGQEHRESGLAARLLLAFPPRVTKRWTEAGIDPSVEKRIENLIDRLYELQPTYGDDDEPRPVVIEMDDEARAHWIDFYNSHNEEARDLEGDLSAAWSKLEAYAARLALVIHYIRWAAKDRALAHAEKVDCASIDSAICLIEWFKNECRRVYSTFGESDDDREVRELVQWIERRGGSVTPRDLQSGNRQYRESGAAEKALSDLVSAGYGEWEVDDEDGRKGGRPIRRFVLTTVSASAELNNSRDLESYVDADSADNSENELSGSNPWGTEWTPDQPDDGLVDQGDDEEAIIL